jgi:hypothetical protein
MYSKRVNFRFNLLKDELNSKVLEIAKNMASKSMHALIAAKDAIKQSEVN